MTGLHVLLIEREPRLGGRLNRLPRPFEATSNEAPRTEGKAWAILAKNKLEHAGTVTRLNTRLFGIYKDNRLACATRSGLLDVKARALVMAPGSYDAYDPFPGADRAGVLLAGAALRLLNEYGVTPGDEVAIVGATRQGLQLARDLHDCGVRVSAIVDERAEPPAGDPLIEEVKVHGIPILWRQRCVGVSGRAGPRSLIIEGAGRRRVRCETIVLATGRRPSIELFQQAGCRLEYAPEVRAHRPATDERLQTSIENLFAAGSAAGASDEWGSHLSGRLAGLSALHSLSLLADDKPYQMAKDAWRNHLRRTTDLRSVAA